MYALLTQMANDRNAELRRDASSRRISRLARRRKAALRGGGGSAHEVAPTDTVTVRHLDPATDHTALMRLAELDSAEVPQGELIGAELDGSLVAAISLEDHRLIADPFTPTDGVRSLLQLRAAQLV